MKAEARFDCVIVGGGPAGLTAAIYLARFLLHVLVIDGGASRASRIPLSRNLPGFPDGVSGPELLTRLRAQAQANGALIRSGHIDAITRDAEGFILSGAGKILHSRTVLLATGISDIEPEQATPQEIEAYVASGLFRYCPICDGYEARDSRVGVIGKGSRAIAKAEFLLGFTDNVTLVVDSERPVLTRDEREQLQRRNIAVVELPISGFSSTSADAINVHLDGRVLTFDTVYPAFGARPHNELAISLGVETTQAGCLLAGDGQNTASPGVFATGDVVEDLDQMSVAFGHAANAAIAIRKYLLDAR